MSTTIVRLVNFTAVVHSKKLLLAQGAGLHVVHSGSSKLFMLVLRVT